MEFEIVKGIMSDLDEVERLYNDLNDVLEEGRNYPGWKKGIYPIRETAEKGIKEGNLYIAKYRGSIVGSVILNHEPEKAYEGVKWKTLCDYEEVLVVRTFVVSGKYFRCGIGGRIMEFISEQGKDLGIKSIRLDVYEKNIPAIKLYEKYGYDYVATVDLGLSEYGLDWFKLYEK